MKAGPMCSAIVPALLILLGAASGCRSGASARDDYPIQPVSFTRVRLSDSFWAPRIETNRVVTIPFAMRQNRETGRVDNFSVAGGLKAGRYQGERYNDTDVYKVMEGAAYSLAVHPDPVLEAELDSLIELIAAAQEEDGYLFTSRTIDPASPAPGTGEERWSELAVSHELYNMGHMFEAAAAHFQATGKRNFLDVALRCADLLTATFGPDRLRAFPGHQEVELGLVKLFRVTGRRPYLDLARFFLDIRGRGQELRRYPEGSRFAIYNDPVQIQAHLPVLEQAEAVGHAVRAMYMYSGMADVAALTGETSFTEAIDRLWENVVGRRMYLTGGVGARHDRERFGEDYELPNLTAYNETCAAIGMVFWNHRLFLLHGDASYLDVMERVLYNGVLAGVSLEGDGFFYPNPLESDGEFRFNKGKAARQPWFGVACCPGNITRFLPSVPGYAYAVRGRDLFVNLYAGGEARVDLEGNPVGVRQETRYPWEGEVRVTLSPERPLEFALLVRIPGWARNLPVPGGLYRYREEKAEAPVIRVNGEVIEGKAEKGFVRLERSWNPGDSVELSLPMPVRLVLAHERVEADRGRTALERGPLVYCAEWPDNGGRVLDLALPDLVRLSARWRGDLLGGIMTLEGEAIRSSDKGKAVPFTAIPYYAWAHRGPGEMAVWLMRSAEGR